MPRPGKPVPPPQTGGAEEELTVVVLKLKGSGDTLKRGFDTLNHAFQAMIPSLIEQQTGWRSVGTNGPQKRVGAAPLAEDGVDGSDVIDAEYSDTDEPEVSPAKQAARSGPPRPRSVYKYLSDFKLDASDEHWQDFAARKNPKTDNERYLIAAEWITKNGGQEIFTANHVFSCFRAMKWDEIKDFTQPMRAMKVKDSFFENPSRKKWKLTGLGLKAAAAVSHPPA